MSRPTFGTDGVRGSFPDDLTPEYVYVLGRAIAKVLGTDVPFVIGRDTRSSGPILFSALSEGIKLEGGKVEDLEVLSTPGIAMFARKSNSRACAITASHNPAGDNGIKVFDVGANKIDSNIEQQIEHQITELMGEQVPEIPLYQSPTITGMATSLYVQYLLDNIEPGSLEGMKIVLDCANGAAYGVAPVVFQMSGAQVIAINTESDGIRINDNCGATHLEQCVASVKENNANIGFAFDGDADRVIAVDNKGNVRNGDDIMALFAIEMKQKGTLNNDSVVVTIMSNGALTSFLKNNGISTSEVTVGDKYVLSEMLDKDFMLGGEQSGHIIRRDIANWGDGILNALLVAQIINNQRSTDSTLSSYDILSMFTPLIQLHDKVVVDNKYLANDSVLINELIISEEESLGEGSRVIIRPSGTEDIVRITVEGPDEARVRESIDRIKELVVKVCS